MPHAACPGPETEAALLARLASNDEADGYAAAVEIVTRYRAVMEEAAWYILDAWDPAEDVAQEVSLTFIRNHRTIVVREGLQRYFGHAARTRALNLLRAERRAQQRGTGVGAGHALAENEGLLYLAADDLAQEVSRVIAVMPERQRRIFVRITRDRHTRQQVADEFGISLQTVGNNMWQASSDIRRCLANGTWTRRWNQTDLIQITDAVWTLVEKQHV